MVESRGGNSNLSDWQNLSIKQQQEVKTMFQKIADELLPIWVDQAKMNHEQIPNLVVREVKDGIEIFAQF